MKEWTLLKRLSQSVADASELPPGVFAAIATRLEEAIADGSREELMSMDEQLSAFLKAYLSKAKGELAGAVRGAANCDTDTAAAYVLGQISFAQLLAGQAGNRRVEEHFANLVEEHGDIVRALFARDLTGLQLAEATGLRPETISRKLKLLREAGISDFYREGTSLFNFLTPAAKALASDIQVNVDARHGGAAIRRALSGRRNRLDPHMRHALTFAPPTLGRFDLARSEGGR
ncbi:helix-turn-helix domain-containing protein [Ensifer aridi]|uniref:helix-turn-helix domain-containing protein n=1 Tax=Ensifer aridi TaxID=1708715 RepID=UPI000A0FC69B|nr:helix-turn-helix domain-containing protein [Ensifer aridi]